MLILDLISSSKNWLELHSLTQLLIVSKIPRIFNAYCKSDFGAFEIRVLDVNSLICKLNFKKFYFILFFFIVVLESVLQGLFSIIFTFVVVVVKTLRGFCCYCYCLFSIVLLFLLLKRLLLVSISFTRAVIVVIVVFVVVIIVVFKSNFRCCCWKG